MVNANYFLRSEEDAEGGNAHLWRKKRFRNALSKKKGNQELRMRFVQFVYVDYFG
jgi:hypothetical protein